MKPTVAQEAAFKSESPLTFVIAGAGSGKTRTLIWRIEHLINDRDIEPEKIVAITFTNAAAREIQKRLGSRRLGYIGTLHSFMLRLLRQHHALVGYKPMINVLDEEESEAFLVKVETDQKYIGTQEELYAAIAAGPPLPSERFTKARLVAAAYYKALKSANLMTFDAILIYGLVVCQHLKLNGSLPFSCFLIDEVQDSSAIDFKIYGSFLGDRYFVADTDQAIYSFRGGDVSLCLKLATVAKVLLLEENFRCGSSICDAAQRLIEHNKTRYPKSTRSATGFPGTVEVRTFSDPAVEAAGICNTIATSEMERADIAVLVRTNDLVQEYANHLRAVGIPVAERVFKERPADFAKAKLMLAFLNNPNDDYVAEQWLTALNGPESAARLRQAAMTAFKTLNQHTFRDKFNNVPLAGVVPEMHVQQFSGASIALVERLAAELPLDSTIADLILAVGSQDEGEEVGQGVTVTTIHSSKGREWGLVFLPAFEQQIIPSERKSMNIEEERRLAYVAMTRAKSSLVISSSRIRVPKFGRPVAVPVYASQFIAEAGFTNGL